jgi:hypothetical protein
MRACAGLTKEEVEARVDMAVEHAIRRIGLEI